MENNQPGNDELQQQNANGEAGQQLDNQTGNADSQGGADGQQNGRENWSASDWYNWRKQKEAERSAQVAAAQQAPAGDQGTAQTDPEKEKLQHEIQHYRMEKLVSESPEFAPHKAAIAEALAENRYPGLNVDEVASLIAGRALVAQRQQAEAIARNSTPVGQSARNYPQSSEVDEINKMSLEQLEAWGAQQARKNRG